MAKRHENHKVGSLGELHIARMFEELGYACSAISPDYGEDFFVFGESNGIIEPFRIFVQVRASKHADRRPSAWTEYEAPLTVRNWVLSNELVILVRHNFSSVTTRYCGPEEDVLYWDIDPRSRVPLRCLHEFNSARVPIGLSAFLLYQCAVLLAQLARHRRDQVLASQIATTEQP